MLNKYFSITGFVLLVLVLDLFPRLTRAQQLVSPESGHIEIMLSGSAGSSLDSKMLDSIISIASVEDFLSSPSKDSQNPLAPCAVLTAVSTSSIMNMLFAGISQPSTINIIPPQGTYIFGKYDTQIKRSKGVIQNDKSGKAADIIARIVIFHSWIISTKMNTLITPLNEGQCLELLLDPNKFGKAISTLQPSQSIQTHVAPVSSYITAYGRENGNALLEELMRPDFLDQKTSAVMNPLAPSSLLRAFRMSARINHVWHNELTKGIIDVTNRPELEPYKQHLKDIRILSATNTRAVELSAAVFAAEVAHTNELTSRLINNATERECLEEILSPGTLRAKLLKQGITLPLY